MTFPPVQFMIDWCERSIATLHAESLFPRPRLFPAEVTPGPMIASESSRSSALILAAAVRKQRFELVASDST